MSPAQHLLLTMIQKFPDIHLTNSTFLSLCRRVSAQLTRFCERCVSQPWKGVQPILGMKQLWAVVYLSELTKARGCGRQALVPRPSTCDLPPTTPQECGDQSGAMRSKHLLSHCHHSL